MSEVMREYQEFLASKFMNSQESGFDIAPDSINPILFKFQRDICLWSLQLGKAAVFAERGLGKTFIQVEWAKHVVAHTGGQVLILAPLAVAHQTVLEGQKLGIKVVYCLGQSEVKDNPIVITNYQRLDKFDASQFVGVVLDESGILKSFTGKTKRAIIETFAQTPYKLACTATPAPNDHMELGNHSQFLDVLPSNEMLARWFINDTMKAGGYRLKKHAEKDYWRWLTSWAVCLSVPGDLGAQYDMPEFELPELRIHEHFLKANEAAYERAHEQGRLFPDTNPSAMRLHVVKRESLEDRVAKARELFNKIPVNEPVIIWCDTNYEADALKFMFPEAIDVRGSHSLKIKEERLNAFSTGAARVIIVKPKIAGWGLNWQHCHEMIFVGVNYSFESFYQSVGRSHRFGQKHPVNSHVIYAETAGNVIAMLNKKAAAFRVMQASMNEAMSEYGLFRDKGNYGRGSGDGNSQMILPKWLVSINNENEYQQYRSKWA